MSEAVRLSLSYDPAEDRLALDLLDDRGAATRLWLTQRLFRGLVPALAPLPRAPGEGADDPGRQSWAQAAAVEAMKGSPPVTPGRHVTIGLVHEVNIAPSPERVLLTFRFGSDTREVGLSGVALRQTLAELHRLSVIAGWPTDQWPAWIADPAAEAVATGGVN